MSDKIETSGSHAFLEKKNLGKGFPSRKIAQPGFKLSAERHPQDHCIQQKKGKSPRDRMCD
jgi:hypothetical protein